MRLLFAALMTLVSTMAMAQPNWHLIVKSDGGDSVFIRNGSIHTIAGMKRAWFMRDQFKPNSMGNLSIVTLDEFDCQTRRSRLVQGTGYRGAMGTGDVNGGATSPSEWSYVTPGTIGESKLDHVCID
jgi:hypothetical protein